MRSTLVLLTIFLLLVMPAMGNNDGITFKTVNITVVEVADNITSLTGEQQAYIVKTCTQGKVLPVEWITQAAYWSLLNSVGVHVRKPINGSALMPVWDECDFQAVWDIRVLIRVDGRIARVPVVVFGEVPSETKAKLSKNDCGCLFVAVILENGQHKVASFDPIGLNDTTILPQVS